MVTIKSKLTVNAPLKSDLPEPPMNLIFLCAAKDKPVGGIKVIHQLAETADRLLLRVGGGAFICHPNRPSFRVTWFPAKVRYRAARFGLRLHPKPGLSRIPSRCFDPISDVVVIPELWVRKYALQLKALAVPYVILVQAGYFIGKGVRADLRQAYAAARAIWCVSEDTMDCVRLAYPGASRNLRRFHVAVDTNRFRPLEPKQDWITYIPGKMPRHAELLRLFADPHLPPGWEWKPLQGLSEAEMAETLGRSQIFVSLLELEGFGLPPLEAAFAGNTVIGYHGQGGREYWNGPPFTATPQGDIALLAREVVNAASNCSADAERLRGSAASYLEALRDRYSRRQLEEDVDALIADLRR
jgi:hypothetical protein